MTTQEGNKKLVWAPAVLLGITALLFGITAGKLLVVNAPEHSDVILVLAGETDLRLRGGLEMLRQGYGRRLLIDVPAEAQIYGISQLQIAETYIKSLPEAAFVAVCPIEGLSTKEEAQDVKHCLEPVPNHRILVVTSEFHTRRSLSIFRHEIPGKTFSVLGVRDGKEFGIHWWRHREWAKTCLDEWLRLAWWNAVDRWR